MGSRLDKEINGILWDVYESGNHLYIQVFCVLLPMLGMAMFPIFTVYITTLYTKPKKMPKDL